MLGFHFPENFNYPYYAQSIQDFWRRWHISLSTWFRDYVYIPLGGGRCCTARIYTNLVIVFLLCGLWHGAAWPFVIWGLYHGGFLVIERLGLARWLVKLHVSLRHLYVVLVVMMGWVLFRADTFELALSYYTSLLGAGEPITAWGLWHYLAPETYCALALGVIFSWPALSYLQHHREKVQQVLPDSVGPLFRLSYALVKGTVFLTIGLVSIMSIANGSYNPFIYFRF
jgi:alginate O-acetyltransferase complex protein AlgI